MDEMIQRCIQMMQGMSGMMNGMMGGMMMGGGAGWTSPWFWLGWALFLGAVISSVVAVIWALRRLNLPQETPVEILKRRYAQGGLSAEQFETMKRQLSGD